MGNFSSFQRQKREASVPLPSSFSRLVRPLVSVPSPSRVSLSLDIEAQLGRARRFGHSLDRIAIFPPSRKNTTGLPDHLKTGIERLSGLSLDNVNVHYNSSQPAQVQARAYTQGTQIHLGPGQERYLPHEAWHVVQQKQGRVQPTLQAKSLPINDDRELEREADVMGTKAIQMPKQYFTIPPPSKGFATPRSVVQRKIEDDLKELGMEKIWTFVTHSEAARTLIRKADAKGILVREGGYHGRAMTSKLPETQQVVVYLTRGNDIEADAASLIFELHNALHWGRFEVLDTKVGNKEITDPDEYAREKIMIEIDGMIRTGKIGSELYELAKDKQALMSRFYIPNFLNYSKAKQGKQDLTIKEFAKIHTNEVLDRAHEAGTHREVYRQQFAQLRKINPEHFAAVLALLELREGN